MRHRSAGRLGTEHLGAGRRWSGVGRGRRVDGDVAETDRQAEPYQARDSSKHDAVISGFRKLHGPALSLSLFEYADENRHERPAVFALDQAANHSSAWRRLVSAWLPLTMVILIEIKAPPGIRVIMARQEKKESSDVAGYRLGRIHRCGVRHPCRDIVLGRPANPRPEQISRSTSMPAQPRGPIQHCPLCRIAMVGSKSTESSPQLDTFTCLKCETVITTAPSSRGPKRDR
jgi:hypothetical protein